MAKLGVEKIGKKGKGRKPKGVPVGAWLDDVISEVPCDLRPFTRFERLGRKLEMDRFSPGLTD